MIITVVNIRSFNPSKGKGLYIGRSTSDYWKSLLPEEHQYDLKVGNPFSIGKDGNRDEVIDKYSNWLNAIYTRNGYGHRRNLFDVVTSIIKAEHPRKDWYPVDENRKRPDLSGCTAIQLICWCHPESCHGNVIKDFLYKEIEKAYFTIQQNVELDQMRDFMEPMC